MPGLKSEHPDYKATKSERRMMRDCIAGDKAVKDPSDRKTYLPGFEDDPNDVRYNKYITRAIFTGYTGRALKKTVGAIFRKEPTVELPTVIEYLLEDATGSGQSLEQFAKDVSTETNAVGRVGILTDYPQKGEDVEDQEQVDAAGLKARFKIYTSENIYNWRSVSINGKEVFTQIRLIEDHEKVLDEFTSVSEKRYRILDLFDGEVAGRGYYRQRLFGEDGGLISEVFPLNNKGQYWDRIPFEFAGAEDNTSKVDRSPFYDLAVLNLAHYRNSADFEDGLHIFNQGTLVINPGNMTADQFEKQNGKRVKLGSRRALVLGEGGKAEIIQPEPGTGGLPAMEAKEKQIETFGVNIFSGSGTNQTAEEARIKAGAESSVLSVVVGNCSEAIEASIENACEFTKGANPEEVEFSLNREFFPDLISPEMIKVLEELTDGGKIGISDMLSKLRKGGVIDPSRTDEEILKEAKEKNNGTDNDENI